MGPAELEERVETLYGGDLDAFTKLRNDTAKELRKAGEGEAAALVAALRKPSVSAWAINRLARTARKEMDALLDSGHELREAQRGLLGGGDQQRFAAARKRHASQVDKLVARAEKLLEEERGTASAAALDRIRATLEAASVSDEGRELLARGRLTEDVAHAGFEALGSAEDFPVGAAPDRRAQRERIGKLERELREARDEERELARAAGAAEAEATDAQRHADTLAKRARAARDKADKAEEAASALDAALKDARAT
jgi:hypothetical protein